MQQWRDPSQALHEHNGCREYSRIGEDAVLLPEENRNVEESIVAARHKASAFENVVGVKSRIKQSLEDHKGNAK